jgi:predicted GNAT superfamily acetyltransferase
VEQAQTRAGITIAPLRELDDFRHAAELWRDVWDRTGEPPVPSELMRAIGYAGNYVSGAYHGGTMVGALLGFYAGDAGADHLHSHILGVDETARARGVGFALKLHQRMWALERGIDRIAWTYDPLVRVNGFFNTVKLGAEGVEYLVDFYGAMPDTINGGDQSDRILVSWSLTDAHVDAAVAGTAAKADLDELMRLGGVTVLEAGPDDRPVTHRSGHGLVLCHTPRDIVGLRRTSPQLAHAWRTALREVMLDAFGRGLRLSGMTGDGWYVLSRTAQLSR